MNACTSFKTNFLTLILRITLILSLTTKANMRLSINPVLNSRGYLIAQWRLREGHSTARNMIAGSVFESY